MSWSRKVKLAELDRGPVRVRLEPDADARKAIARRLGLRSLPSLRGDITVKPWLDGAEIGGRFEAVVEQVCGVSLEPFEDGLDGDIELRAVPAGSPNLPSESAGGELELDLDAPDPPDELDSDEIDLGEVLVEHLALAIDPFPRKPGAVFDYQPDPEVESPFAALRKLQDPKA